VRATPGTAARLFPTGTGYLDALQDPAACFADPDLAAATPQCTPLGLPRPVSGNFASVFRMDGDDGRSWAVRCFVRWFDDLGQRYDAIVQHLNKVPGSWKVGFELQERGIHVGGEWWPVLKMDWAAGTPLIPWIESHLWDGPALAYQAVRFAELVDELRRSGVAHGDLQHGNLLLAPGGDIRLVDYDGMFVPTLSGLAANDGGHRNYQHPRRRPGEFGLHIDNFAAWVIYTSLVALAVDPLLWGRLDGGDECLLFRAQDFHDPRHSEAFAALDASGDRVLGQLAGLLRSFLDMDLGQVPPLSPARAPMPVLSAPALDQPALADRRRLLRALRDEAAPETFRPRPHAPVAEVSFTHMPAPRGATAGLAGLALLVLLGLMGGVLPLPLGLVLLAMVAGGGYAGVHWLWLQSPEVAAFRDTQAECEEAFRRRDEARAAVERVQQQRAAVDEAERDARARAGRAAEEVQAGRDAALRAIDQDVQERLAALAAREQELYRAEHTAYASALRDLQRQVIDADLGTRSLSSFAGLDDRVIYALALDGVRSAADFVDVFVENEGRPSAEVAWLVRPDGGRVKATGLTVGPARGLLSWRRGLEARLSASLPARLPEDMAGRVRATHAAERAALATQEQQVRAEGARRARAVAGEPGAGAPGGPGAGGPGAGGPGATPGAPATAAHQRVRLDQELGRAKKVLAEAEWSLEGAERSLEAYRGLTFLAFVRRIAGLA